MFLRDVGIYLQFHMAIQPRRATKWVFIRTDIIRAISLALSTCLHEVQTGSCNLLFLGHESPVMRQQFAAAQHHDLDNRTAS
jgi:hypothetical protein